MARRSIVLAIFIAILAAACSTPSKPSATPSSTLAAVVVTPPPTATPTATPTKAPPTKAPKPTKKPKPTPTPVAWSAAYKSHVCDATAALASSKSKVDEAAARLAAGDTPHARTAAFEVISLSVQANGAIGGMRGWATGDDLKTLLAASASSLGDGATQFLDGLTALNYDVIHKAQTQMGTGGDQLAQAQTAIADLGAIYGPAGC